ncbi:hypothetical protein [Streptomyces sp. adm13(2018)]|uniref:hypothetical protein n=1 Tax=Streptomyces sp. adm13(2018) TaxID=2479007 RepID=UPI0021C62CCA|nr:hypothetical protein [Streptomyces sp. adm13(2018)]
MRCGAEPTAPVSEGAASAVVIAPGDTRGTVLIPEKRGGACCGFADGDGEPQLPFPA